MFILMTNTSIPRFKSLLARSAIVLSVLSLSVMWIYAFVFASKESVNKIEDQDWTARAESICQEAFQERLLLIDLRQISDSGPDALAQRADIVDNATDILEAAIIEIDKQSPVDAKGLAIVPLWISDYKTLISDRRDYTELLRTGDNSPFSESMTEGLPISEKISTFAADNEMKSCKAPIDLSI
jgi:hypothetical protein